MKAESAWAIDTIVEAVHEISDALGRTGEFATLIQMDSAWVVIHVMEPNPFRERSSNLFSGARLTTFAVWKDTGAIYSMHNGKKVEHDLGVLPYDRIYAGLEKVIENA